MPRRADVGGATDGPPHLDLLRTAVDVVLVPAGFASAQGSVCGGPGALGGAARTSALVGAEAGAAALALPALLADVLRSADG